MKKAWLALLFGAALVLGACGGDDSADNNNDGGTADETPKGEQLVMNSCTSCHGGQLQGMGNTPGLADIGSRMSEEEILDIIVNGQGGMPGGLLKGEDAEAAAAWLAEQK